jgi:arylsulfatase A-like enzyme
MNDPKSANVVVIACNALHLGFLGAYGNAWIETPTIDRLAVEGIVFDHHFAENLTTLPTRRSWWTGRYGFADPESGWTPLRSEERILPDLVWNRGVRTALISDVPYLREAGQGFGRGFDDVVWIRGAGYDPYIPSDDPRACGVRVAEESGLPLPPEDDPDHALWLGRWSQFLRNRTVLASNRDPANTSVARSVDAAIDWLERASRPRLAQPFLLWLDLFSPHGPWDPPEPYRDQYAAIGPDEFETDEEGDLAEDLLAEDAIDLEDVRILIDVPPGVVGEALTEAELFRLRRTYAGCVSLLDAQLGRLMEALRRLGRLEDTLIVFTADQGEPLGEHGLIRRFRPWLYDELIHTPLILRLPGGEAGGIRHQALVQTVDILPTVLEALGCRCPDDPPVHGRSILPLARGQQTKIRDFACLGMDLEEYAIRTHRWHLVLPLEVDPDDPERLVELYHKPEDRWDQNNVVEQFPDLADHLEVTLRRFAEATQSDRLDEVPPLREFARFG